MTPSAIDLPTKSTIITWEKLPDDFILPDEPVDNNLQPLLAAALRESLELAGLILESMLIASNFGLCATVKTQTVVKAPDWVYIPSVKPIPSGTIRRSYTPHIEGEIPTIVLEFISETEGGEYSINPHYPYGKWYFYEQILQVPVYGIFQPKTGELDVYCLVAGKYEQQLPDENNRYWIAEINLFLGVWQGKKAEVTAYWLRWWDKSGNLLLWGNELVEQEKQRTEQEKQRAEQEKQRAEQAELELEREQISRQRLVQKLKELGVNPENL
ncbi:Uma2 family endonuclease [Microcystis protocystis FBCC-A270]|uniref:Uma2 family endonuclease n=1 Tax=Microcystis protocystis TaxID=629747 RepID=UPI003D275491